MMRGRPWRCICRILRAIEAGDTDTAGFLARAKGEIQQSEASYRKLA